MTDPKSSTSRRRRIVLTGGPGGGKTTAADLFRRELGERVVIVPEAATLLFSGGFPRSLDIDAVYCTQAAIYHVQSNLEDVQHARFHDRILLCDRGTVDGAAYWPGNPEDFFEALGTTLENELKRYDAVIYFESAAAGQMPIEGGNPIRNESIAEAHALDVKLHKIWSAHPNFHFVPNQSSFFKKVTMGFELLSRIADQLNHRGAK